MSSLAHQKHEEAFFYNQKTLNEGRQKRKKKIIDDKTLANLLKKFNNKFPPTAQTKDGEETSRTLQDRLGELITTSKSRVNSAASHTTATSNRKPASSTNGNPNAFTDTRLQGIRFLTEDTIKELERLLVEHLKYDITPLLPSQIVYEWHSNWADLTEKCKYLNFPVWQTRQGRDSMIKREKGFPNRKNSSSGGGHGHGHDTDRSGASSRGRKSSNHKLGSIIGTGGGGLLAGGSNLSKLTSISEKKGPVQSNMNKENGNPSLSSSNNIDAISTNVYRSGPGGKRLQGSLTNISESSLSNLQERSALQTAKNQNLRNDSGSRLTQSTNPIGGANNGDKQNGLNLVNYQLSNFQFTEKGWTVITTNLEDKIADNHKKLLQTLKISMLSIEEVRNVNEKFGCTYKCRYRLYGEYRKEQMEKYKSSNLKAKKSQFAMAILRNELPKPLDIDQIMSSITSPSPSNTVRNEGKSHPLRPTKSASNVRARLNNQNNALDTTAEIDSVLSRPTPPTNSDNFQNSTPFIPSLLNTQTNDGTSCVYYPSGQLAILATTVYGYFIDTVPVISNINNNTLNLTSNSTQLHNPSNNSNSNNNISILPQNQSSTINKSGLTIITESPVASSLISAKNTERGLTGHIVKESFNTVIFAENENPIKNGGMSGHTPLSSYSFSVNNEEENTKEMNKNQKNQKKVGSLQTSVSTSSTMQLDLNNERKQKRGGGSLPVISNNERQILASISSSGACVCYRDNGTPRFVCTDMGGYLCNQTGCVTYQWKWKDVHLSQYDDLVNKLNIQLNEFVHLEYKNPYNIKLKYICGRETITLNVGALKDNNLKLQDLLNRTVSDLPLKSSPGNLKLLPSARGHLINTYKQQHLNNTSARKASISFASGGNSTASIGANSIPGGGPGPGSGIEKLLETSNVPYKDIAAMRDLLTVQKRIRTILEDWQSHCRSCLNILSPTQYIFPIHSNQFSTHQNCRLNEDHRDFNKIVLHKRKSNSVLGFNTNSQNNNVTFNMVNTKKPKWSDEEVAVKPTHTRSISAAMVNRTKQLTKQHMDLIENIKHFKNQVSKGQFTSNSKFKLNSTKKTESERRAQEETLNIIANSFKSSSNMTKNLSFLVLKPKPECIDSTHKLPAFYRQHTMPALKVRLVDKGSSDNELSDSEQYIAQREQRNKSGHCKSSIRYSNEKLSMCCPVLLHSRLAFERDMAFECKCRKQSVPLLNDVEYDTILRIIPPEQFAIIVVVDQKRQGTNIENIITEMYANFNRNRTQPCKESLKDEIRFFKYDLSSAFIDSDHSLPLLVTRHNVSVGMVLIYKNCNLVFCDNIFNGYSYGEQDFIKQLKSSSDDAKEGKFLPYNFRFSHVGGRTEGKRAPWGGTLSGTIPELGTQLNKSVEIASFLRETSRLSNANSKFKLSKSMGGMNEKVHLPQIIH